MKQKLPHEVQVDSNWWQRTGFNIDDYLNWAREQGMGEDKWDFVTIKMLNGCFRFECREDAIAFRLRYGS